MKRYEYCIISNKMKWCVAVLFALTIVSSLAQEPLKCSTPIRWKGTFREINFADGSMRFANESYDATIEAIAITDIERGPGDRERFERVHEVFLFRERKSYRVDLQTGSCTVSDLSEWQPFGVREDDTFYGTEYIGSKIPTYGVKVNQYFRRNDGDYSASFAPVTSAECIPVLESFIRASSGGHPPAQKPVNLHVQFLNVIPVTTFPPETFMKPPQCL